jgi:hypothetical protein
MSAMVSTWHYVSVVTPAYNVIQVSFICSVRFSFTLHFSMITHFDRVNLNTYGETEILRNVTS